MQVESQVMVREFNRRLRTALSSAPNHVRVEAALEVESHVMDVLSRQKSGLSESEQVAEILSGFGSPEEYARAIMAQLPGVQVVDVPTGAREVSMAAIDLMRGLGRLLVALIRRLVALLMTGLHWLRVGLVWALGKLRWGVRALRGPAGRLITWLGRRANQLRRGAHVLRLWLGRRAHDAGVASRGARTVAAALFRWAIALLRRLLRAAGYTALGGLALAAFAFAGLTALLPDVVGYWVYHIQKDVNGYLTDIRRQTVFLFDQSMQAQFTSTGNAMLVGAILFGLSMVGLISLLVWNARRRRSTVVDHS